MAQVTSAFTGTNGATLATTDAGSPSKYDTVSIGADGSTLTYDNSLFYGTPTSMKYVSGSSGGQGFVQWSTQLGSISEMFGRFYLYVTAFPTGGNQNLVTLNVGVGRCFVIVWNVTTGTFSVLGDGAAVGTTTHAASLGAWMRIEFHCLTGATGIAQMELFLNPQATTPDETIGSVSTSVASGNFTTALLGNTASGGGGSTLHIDEATLGATSYPGPVVGTQIHARSVSRQLGR